MKKVHLYAASALLAVLLTSGVSHAATNQAASATAKETVAVQGEAKAQVQPKLAQPLSEEKMKLVRESMDKASEEQKPLLAQSFKVRKEMKEIMAAPTFDRKAYLAKHEEMQKLQAQIADIRVNSIADVATKLTPEERASLPPLMMKGPRGMGMRGPGGMMGRGMMGQPPMDGPAPAPVEPAEGE